MSKKRILAMHDLSCRGEASLGIVMEILPQFDLEVVKLPSVILSSSTDLDDEPIALATTIWLDQVLARYKEQKLKFDAIYTGWLQEPEQVLIITDFISYCRHILGYEPVVLVDPVMADCGEFYPHQKRMVKAMQKLVEFADIVTPNPTEAAFLIGSTPQSQGVSQEGTIIEGETEGLVNLLTERYPRALPVMKSVISEDNAGIGVCVKFTPENTPGNQETVFRTLLYRKMNLPSIGGTGDRFASLLLGKWLKDINEKSSIDDKAALIKSIVVDLSRFMGKYL